MFRKLTRLLCFVVSFQLFVGCNGAQLSLQGEDGNFFNVSGLIVKGLQNANDLMFPSAVAATATGEVIVYTVDEFNQSVEIGSYTLYDGNRSFSFKVDKEKVNKDLLFFKYAKIGAVDRREKFEVLPGNTSEIYTELDSEGTFSADILKQKISEAIGKSLDYGAIKEIVKKFDTSIYEEAIFKQFNGSFENYVSEVNNSELANYAGAIFSNNPKPAEGDLNSLNSAILNADKTGTKLNCKSLSSVEAVDSSTNGWVDLALSFSTSDTPTKDAGFDNYNIGQAFSENAANVNIAEFLNQLKNAANSEGTPMTGYLIAYDKLRDITSTCRLIIQPD